MYKSNGHKRESKDNEEKEDTSLLLPCLLVFAAAVVCFVNSYDGEFVFDDTEAVLNNKDVDPAKPLSDVFNHDFWGRKLGNLSHKSYRPLTVLTFRWNHWLASGLHPKGFHIGNILLHGLVSCLLLPVFQLCLQSRSGLSAKLQEKALFAGLLFAVHPVHTESVAGIVGRADLLCALFFVLSFLSYVKGCCIEMENTAIPWIGVSMMLCAAATFCKEQGITVIGICCAYDVLLQCKIDFGSMLGFHEPSENTVSESSALNPEATVKLKQKDFILRQLILLVSGIILLTVRWQVMGSAPPTFQVFDNPHSFVNGTIYRALNYNYLYAINAWLLLCPLWLCFDWSMGCIPTLTQMSDPRLIGVVVLWLAAAVLAWGCLMAKDASLRRFLTLCTAFIVIPFLPASNLLFRVGFVVAERSLYLPSIGFCMLMALGVDRVAKYWEKRTTVLSLFGLLLVIFAARSIQRSNEWRHGLMLYESAEKVCPLNAKVHYNIAKTKSEMDEEGQVEEIITRYRHAIELNPDYDQAMNNLANILKDRGQELEAETLLDKAVTLSPDFAAAWMNRGIVKAALHKHYEAENSYKQALRCRRKYPDCYYNLGNLYVETNRSQDALNAFYNATQLKPTHWSAWNNAIILLDNLGFYDKASQMAYEGLKKLPDHPSLLFSLANVLGKAEKWEESEKAFLAAAKVNPKNPSLHTNLGVLYHRWGRLEEAQQAYQKALQIDPNNRVAKENYKMLLSRMGGSNQTTKAGKR